MVHNDSYASPAATLRAYLRDQRAAGHTPATLRLRRGFLVRWAATVTADTDLLDSMRTFLACGRWSPATRACAAAALRSWLRWAADTGMDVPPVESVVLPRVPHRQPRPLPDTVTVAALSHCDERTTLMILLAREAGLRRAEIAKVHTRDYADGQLTVRGKGGKERTVPLSPMLAEQIAAAPAGWLFPAACDPDRPVRPGVVGDTVARALGAGPHRLRHAFATAAYGGGHDIIAVQQLLGHASVATSMCYIALGDDALRRSVDAGRLGTDG